MFFVVFAADNERCAFGEVDSGIVFLPDFPRIFPSFSVCSVLALLGSFGIIIFELCDVCPVSSTHELSASLCKKALLCARQPLILKTEEREKKQRHRISFLTKQNIATSWKRNFVSRDYNANCP